jgi:hypothetical protein
MRALRANFEERSRVASKRDRVNQIRNAANDNRGLKNVPSFGCDDPQLKR